MPQCLNFPCPRKVKPGSRGLCTSCYTNLAVRNRFPVQPRVSKYDNETLEDLDRLIEKQKQKLPKNFYDDCHRPIEPAWVRARDYVLSIRPDSVVKWSISCGIHDGGYAVWDGHNRLSNWHADENRAWMAASRNLGKQFVDVARNHDRHALRRK